MIKNKKIIFIIWGLFISLSIIGLLIILLLFLEPKQSPQSFNQPVEVKPIQSSSQQEEEREVIKYTEYNPDGTIDYITEHDEQTGNKTKHTEYNYNGKITFITEYDPHTGKQIKHTDYNPDGTVKEVRNL